jgi:hypothetical protein
MEPITGIQISLGAIFILGILFYIKMLFTIGKKDHDSFVMERLNSIKREVAFYPINEQVQYSDVEIRSKIDDYTHIKAYLDGAELDCLHDFTTSTIGNLAYIALFYDGKECREIAHSYLQGYKTWVQQQFPDEYQKYIDTHGDSRN